MAQIVTSPGKKKNNIISVLKEVPNIYSRTKDFAPNSKGDFGAKFTL